MKTSLRDKLIDSSILSVMYLIKDNNHKTTILKKCYTHEVMFSLHKYSKKLKQSTNVNTVELMETPQLLFIAVNLNYKVPNK